MCIFCVEAATSQPAVVGAAACLKQPLAIGCAQFRAHSLNCRSAMSRMSFSLNSLKRVIWGTTTGVIKRHTWSLDHSHMNNMTCTCAC